MQKINVTFDSLPSAMGLLLDRVAGLEAKLDKLCSATDEPTDARRMTKGAEGLARYLKDIPKSTVYGMRHRGLLDSAIRRMPGSRALYFDLDAIDALMAKKEVAA